MKRLSNILVALIATIFIFCFSVIVVLNLRSIYYYDIKAQNLEEQTGLSEETIRANYDTLIDYNLITTKVKKLEFPNFPMSENGRTHFIEVKRIFVAIQYLYIVSGALLLIGLWSRIRRRDPGFLKLVSILTILIPAALGIAAAVNWETFFVTFHKIMFKNDFWLFNPATDPVILILPDAFFLHCAVAILVFILIASILNGILYRILTRNRRKQEKKKINRR